MEELKKKYDQMLKDIETASIFDGRGTGVDVYICEKCGNNKSLTAAENILRRGISELWSGSKTVSDTASRACTQESHVL